MTETDALRLMCDEMLASLARWLRAAGYDTALAEPGTADTDILRACIAEGRILISRDRLLVAAARDRIQAVLLGDGSLDDHAQALAQELGLDWGAAPFTRCLIDNSLLRAANETEIEAVPAPFRTMEGEVRTCPQCTRTYWPGGHVRRMRQRLELWRTRS